MSPSSQVRSIQLPTSVRQCISQCWNIFLVQVPKRNHLRQILEPESMYCSSPIRSQHCIVFARRDIIEAAVYSRLVIGKVNFNNLGFDMMDVPSTTNLGFLLFGAKSKSFRGRSKGSATPIAPGLKCENGASDTIAPLSARMKRITCKSRYPPSDGWMK